MINGRLKKGVFRFSGQQLLGSLVVLLIAYPFFEALPSGDYLASILFSLVLLSSLFAVGGRRRVLIAGIVLMSPALTFRWLPHFTSMGQQDPIPLLSMALAVAFTIWQLLRFVLRARRVDSEVLCSGISIYILAGMLWAQFYLLTQNAVPGSFSTPAQPGGENGLTFFDALYFSLSTLTTAGYGGVAPVSRHARALASLEALCGVLYVTVLISRLVSLYVRAPVPADIEDPKL
jgi:hypothetical protein